MAVNQTASALTIWGGVKGAAPAPLNTQIIPLSKVQHYTPSSLGNSGGFVTAPQLLNGALVGAPTGAVAVVWQSPTAANLLASYASVRGKVAVNDVFRVSVFNNGSTGIVISPSGSSASGATGSFSASTGTMFGTVAGAESILHIRWLEVSPDGTTGAYQLY